MPVSPSTTRSSSPPTAVATTGRPWAIASRQATPNPSRLDGQATTAARAYSCCSSSCGTKPCAPGTCPRSGPSPATTRFRSPRPPRPARARPFPARGVRHRGPRAARPPRRPRGGRSTPLGTTRTSRAPSDASPIGEVVETPRSRAARREARHARTREHARRSRRPSPTPGRRTACRCGPRPSRPEASGRAGGPRRRRAARTKLASSAGTNRAEPGPAAQIAEHAVAVRDPVVPELLRPDRPRRRRRARERVRPRRRRIALLRHPDSAGTTS